MVVVAFEFQTAHQAATDPRDLAGVQRQILIFRHSNGNGLKFIENAVAAEHPTAGGDTAHHFGFIPDADLAQFNTGTENANQVFDQLTEVHTAIGGKTENDFPAVKGVFHINELHIQIIVPDFFQTDLKGLFLFDFIFFIGFFIGFRGLADDIFQRLDHFLVTDLPGCDDNGAVFHSPGRFHNHMVVEFQIQSAGAEIIDFSGLFKSYTNYSFHAVLRFFLYTGENSPRSVSD